MDMYQHAGFGKAYQYSSQCIPYSPQYANFKSWEDRNCSIRLNQSAKAKEIVSNFDEWLSDEDEKDYDNWRFDIERIS